MDADSYEAQVVAAAIAMLAASSTWQTWIGAADATAARGRIVETWTGIAELLQEDGTATAVDGTTFDALDGTPWAIVSAPGLAVDDIGVDTVAMSYTVAAAIMWQPSADHTPGERYRAGRNQIGAIRDDIQALFGSAGMLALGAVSSEGPTASDLDDVAEAMLIIEGRG